MTEPPRADDAERVVLGSMLLDPSAAEVVTARLVTASFYTHPHQVLFAHLVASWVAGDPTDPVAMTHRLLAAGELERVGGAPYLHKLTESVPTVAQVGHHAGLVADAADRRALLEEGARLSQAAGVVDAGRRAVVLAEVRERLDKLCGSVEAEGEPTLAAIPDYPSSVLAGPLGELVAASGGIPDALMAGAGLAAIASVCGRARIHVDDTMVEPPILWVPLLAARGAGKTPALAIALGPIYDLDAEAYRLYRDELDMWKGLPKKERGERPVNPTRLVDDTTLERLARRLGAGDGIATVASDEIANFLGGLDRYRGGGDRARMLALWSGRPWQYERVGDDTDILVPAPVVSIVGGLQPPLHKLLGGEEDGMRPRWLPHAAALDPIAHERGGMARKVGNWSSTLEKLHRTTNDRTWGLTGEARTAWQSARVRWKRTAAGGETASTSAALVKADTQCARVALVLAESMNPGDGGDIPVDAVRAAVAIVDYVIDCWRAIPEQASFALSRRDEVLNEAIDRLRAWLEEHGGEATRTELLRAQVAGIRTADDLDALTKRYEQVYPGTVQKVRTGGRGRPGVKVVAPARRDRR